VPQPHASSRAPVFSVLDTEFLQAVRSLDRCLLPNCLVNLSASQIPFSHISDVIKYSKLKHKIMRSMTSNCPVAKSVRSPLILPDQLSLSISIDRQPEAASKDDPPCLHGDECDAGVNRRKLRPGGWPVRR
jgi:hypothetical protein